MCLGREVGLCDFSERTLVLAGWEGSVFWFFRLYFFSKAFSFVIFESKRLERGMSSYCGRGFIVRIVVLTGEYFFLGIYRFYSYYSFGIGEGRNYFILLIVLWRFEFNFLREKRKKVI